MNTIWRKAATVMKVQMMDQWTLVGIPALIALMMVCNKFLMDTLPFLTLVPCVILIILAVKTVKNNSLNNGNKFTSFLISSGYSRTDLYNAEVLITLCLVPFFFVICFCLGYMSNNMSLALHIAVLLTSVSITAVMIISALFYSSNRRVSIAAGIFALLLTIPFGFMAYAAFSAGDPVSFYVQSSAVYAVICFVILYVLGRRIIAKYDC